MAINNDRNLLEQQILTKSGLQGKALENLKSRLATLTEQELQAELSKALTGDNKEQWYTGVLLEHNDSVVMLDNYDNATYTDEKGNEISELKDGDEVLERTIKSVDENGNTFETKVSFANGKPLSQTKSKNGNTIETTTYEYNDDSPTPFVTVQTKKANNSTVITDVLEIDENGNFDNEDFIDRQTNTIDGTVINIYTENNCVIEKQVKPDGKIVETIYIGDSIEAYDDKKLHRAFQRTELNGKVHEVEYDGDGNTKTVVQNGETPAAIARKFGVKESSLLRLNPAKGKGAITQVGADIIVPGEFDADSKVMAARKTKEGAMAEFAKEEAARVANRLYSAAMKEVLLDRDYKNAYDYARALLAAEGNKNPSNKQINDKANEILVANGNIKFTKGRKVKIAVKSNSKNITELANLGFKSTAENTIFFQRFNALSAPQQQCVLSVIKYCKGQNITDQNKIKAKILETYPEINLFDSGKTIPTTNMATPAFKRTNPVSVETFLTETLKLDLKSEVGKTVYERLSSLPQEALNQISTKNFRDLSKSNFTEIARTFETNGLDIRTRAERQTEYNSPKAIQEREKQALRETAAENIALAYDNAINIIKQYQGNQGWMNIGYYREKLGQLLSKVNPTDINTCFEDVIKQLEKDKIFVTRSLKDKIYNENEFKAAFKKLLGGAEYNEENIKAFLEVAQDKSANFEDEAYNKKFWDSYNKVFGVAKTDKQGNVYYEPQIVKAVTGRVNRQGTIDGLADIVAMLYGTEAIGKGIAWAGGKVLAKVSPYIPKVLSSAGAKTIMTVGSNEITVGRLATNIATQSATFALWDAGKNYVNIKTKDIQYTGEAAKEEMAAYRDGLKESAKFGAFAGAFNTLVVSKVVDCVANTLKKPTAIKAVGKVSKSFEKTPSMTGADVMKVYMKSQGPGILAQTAGTVAEICGFTAYETVNEVVEELLVTDENGERHLPAQITEESLGAFLWDKFKGQATNLGEIKAISKLIFMHKGAIKEQERLMDENLAKYETLKNVKIKKTKVNGREIYEVTMPDGNRKVANSIEEVVGNCNIIMQYDMVSNSLKEKAAQESSADADIAVQNPHVESKVKTAVPEPSREARPEGELRDIKLSLKRIIFEDAEKMQTISDVKKFLEERVDFEPEYVNKFTSGWADTDVPLIKKVMIALSKDGHGNIEDKLRVMVAVGSDNPQKLNTLLRVLTEKSAGMENLIDATYIDRITFDTFANPDKMIDNIEKFFRFLNKSGEHNPILNIDNILYLSSRMIISDIPMTEIQDLLSVIDIKNSDGKYFINTENIEIILNSGDLAKYINKNKSNPDFDIRKTCREFCLSFLDPKLKLRIDNDFRDLIRDTLENGDDASFWTAWGVLLKMSFSNSSFEKVSQTSYNLRKRLSTTSEMLIDKRIKKYVNEQIKTIEEDPSLPNEQKTKKLNMLINIVNIANNIDGRYFSNKDFGRSQYAKNFLKYIKRMSKTEGQETNKEIGQTTEKKYTQLYEKLVKRQGKLTEEDRVLIADMHTEYIIKNMRELFKMVADEGTDLALDKDIATYLYGKYIDSVDAMPSDVKIACKKLENKYGTRVFLSSDYGEAKLILDFVDSEFMAWDKASGGTAKFPPILDLLKVKQDYIDPSQAYGEGTAAGFAESSHSKSISIDGNKYSTVEYAIRHEITHINDTKLLSNFENGFVQYKETKDQNGKTKKEIDAEKSKFYSDFKKIGIPESHIPYAYNNPKEFIAVASEGDLTKCSPKFKKVLIEFGMPEWLFGITSRMQVEKDAYNSVQTKTVRLGGEELEFSVTRGADGKENVDFSKARRRNADGTYEEFAVTTKEDIMSSVTESESRPVEEKQAVNDSNIPKPGENTQGLDKASTEPSPQQERMTQTRSQAKDGEQISTDNKAEQAKSPTQDIEIDEFGQIHRKNVPAGVEKDSQSANEEIDIIEAIGIIGDYLPKDAVDSRIIDYIFDERTSEGNINKRLFDEVISILKLGVDEYECLSIVNTVVKTRDGKIDNEAIEKFHELVSHGAKPGNAEKLISLCRDENGHIKEDLYNKILSLKETPSYASLSVINKCKIDGKIDEGLWQKVLELEALGFNNSNIASIIGDCEIKSDSGKPQFNEELFAIGKRLLNEHKFSHENITNILDACHTDIKSAQEYFDRAVYLRGKINEGSIYKFVKYPKEILDFAVKLKGKYNIEEGDLSKILRNCRDENGKISFDYLKKAEELMSINNINPYEVVDLISASKVDGKLDPKLFEEVVGLHHAGFSDITWLIGRFITESPKEGEPPVINYNLLRLAKGWKSLDIKEPWIDTFVSLYKELGINPNKYDLVKEYHEAGFEPSHIKHLLDANSNLEDISLTEFRDKVLEFKKLGIGNEEIMQALETIGLPNSWGSSKFKLSKQNLDIVTDMIKQGIRNPGELLKFALSLGFAKYPEINPVDETI